MAPRSKLLCAVTLALTFALTPNASAATGMEVAVQDDPVLFAGLYSHPEVAFRLAGQLKVTRIRVNVVWTYVVGRSATKRKAPKRVRYNWSGYDSLLNGAAAHGIKLQLVLTGPAPRWAAGNHKIGPVRPKVRYFKAFARAAAKHFKGRIDRYSIWNEPNHRAWLAPIKSAARQYRALYLAGYSAIKRADPNAQVLIGETSPFALGHGRNATAPLKFLRGVTCANKRYRRAKRCGTLKTDGYAHHPYDFDHKPTYRYPGKDNVTIGVLGRLTKALSKLRKSKALTTRSGGVPDVYLTEYGYFASGKRRVSSATQGKYLVQAFTMAQRNPHVKEMLHYLLLEPSRKFKFFDTSVANRRGQPRLAFKKLAAWAEMAAAAGQIAVATPPPPPDPGGSPDPGSGGGGGGGGSSPPPPEDPPPSNCTVVAGVPIC
jgi:hypothetical protein